MDFHEIKSLLENLYPFCTGRLDIKNYGNENNSIEILSNSDDSSQINYWSWFKDNQGEGVTIQSVKLVLDLKIKCINNGVLKVFLRSKDVKDKNNFRFPIYIDYTSLKVNDIPVLTNHNLCSHDSPYIFEKNVKDSEILSIHCEWMPFNSECEFMTSDSTLSQNQEFLNLKNEVSSFIKTTNSSLDTHNFLFNTLFIDFKQEPRSSMKDLKLVCIELLNFVSNICKKYGLNWWLDYGNLLGAIRHEDFIPWDDDVDIGMMRNDYNKLNAVIENEIKNHGLEDIITLVYKKRKIDDKYVGTFLQILIFHKFPNNKKVLFAGVDVFPYDYLNKFEDKDSLSDLHQKVRLSFYRNLSNNIPYEECLKKCYEELNCSFDKSKFIIPSVESGAGISSNMWPFFVTETDKVFPLKLKKFGQNMFPCPNDSNSYLKLIYGDYMKLPNSIHEHGRVEHFRYVQNTHEILMDYINIFKKVNDSFE